MATTRTLIKWGQFFTYRWFVVFRIDSDTATVAIVAKSSTAIYRMSRSDAVAYYGKLLVDGAKPLPDVPRLAQAYRMGPLKAAIKRRYATSRACSLSK